MGNLASNIRKARRMAGLTQAQLAKQVGVAQSAVTHWEAGDTSPTTQRLARIASVLGTTIDDLLNDMHGHTPTASDILVPLLACTVADARLPSHVCLPYSVAAIHPHAFALLMVDNAMDRIAPPSTVVICDPDLAPCSGNIAAVTIGGGDPIIRRWYQGADNILLVAESSGQHDDIILSPGSGYSILGIVVWVQSLRPLA